MADDNSTDDIQQDLEALRDELRTLARDIRQTGEQQAREGAAEARETYEDIRGEACARVQQISSEVEARPFASIFAAFGIGLLLGRLLGR